MPIATDSGIGTDLSLDRHTAFVLACFLAIALYNVIELNVVIFSVFRKRSGLYFWSFLVSTWGIATYSTGFVLKYIGLSAQNVVIIVLIAIGWCCMVTGQSFVLYSRLHLVLRNTTYLRSVFILIIFDAVVCHIPGIVLSAGSNLTNAENFLKAYSIFERIQVTIFFFQEALISVLYIYQTVKLFRPEGNIRERRLRRVLGHLILVNALVITLDIAVLVLEYMGLFNIQASFKGLAYSIKLKVEFSILNRLVEITQSKKLTSGSEDQGKGQEPRTSKGDAVGVWPRKQVYAVMPEYVTPGRS